MMLEQPVFLILHICTPSSATLSYHGGITTDLLSIPLGSSLEQKLVSTNGSEKSLQVAFTLLGVSCKKH